MVLHNTLHKKQLSTHNKGQEHKGFTIPSFDQTHCNYRPTEWRPVKCQNKQNVSDDSRKKPSNSRWFSAGLHFPASFQSTAAQL